MLGCFNFRRPGVLLTALTLAAPVAGCGGDGGDGKLTVYSGREEELVAPLFKQFEEDSGVDLEVRYGDSAELASTILEEGDATPAEVFFGQDGGALGALEKKERLAELPQDVLDEVDRKFRSKDGRWIGTSGRARVIAYDRRKLDEADLPDSVLELTEDRWKGKVGWAPTNASFQAFVTALRKVEGEEAAGAWLEGMKGNDVQAYEKNTPIRDAIASGEIELGLINHYYVAEARDEEGAGYPVRVHFPPGGDTGSLVNVAGVGVLEGAGDDDDARKLVEFLLGERAQSFFAEETKEYALASGVTPAEGLEPLASIEQPDVDLVDLDDLEGTLDLLERRGVL